MSEVLTLDIPPGVFSNGTPLQSSGRWRDASLVRWNSGEMAPVGGWLQRGTSDFAGPVRGALAWVDFSDGYRLAGGTFDGLKVMNAAGEVTDITPTGYSVGREIATLNRGFGGGLYGRGLYGRTRLDNAAFEEVTAWHLDNYGQFLLACTSTDGRLYQWQLGTAVPAAPVANAPVDNLGLVVTPERFPMVLGAGGNRQAVAWPDVDDITDWTSTATNQARDVNLQTNGQLMCGVKLRGQTLILSATDAFAATFVGGNIVYDFERLGSACGAISRMSAIEADGAAYWMGVGNFFRFVGGTVEPIPCDVRELVFDNLDRQQRSQVWAMRVSRQSEIWWFYPPTDANEPTNYVTYNYVEGHWSTGSLTRTAGVDEGVFSRPLMLDATGAVFEHEQGIGPVGETPFVELSPVSFGGRVATITELLPEVGTLEDMTATFFAKIQPNGPEIKYGPYRLTDKTDVLFSARQFRLRLEGDKGTMGNIGRMSVRYTLRGRQ